VDTFSDSNAWTGRSNREKQALRLKKRIKIDFSTERRGGVYLPTTSFLISYRDTDPELAQKITARLASLFVEQDAKARASQVTGTADFLAAEMQKVEAQLKNSEARLKAIQDSYRNELPDKLEINLRALDRLQRERASNLDALDRRLTMQMDLEREISLTPREVVAGEGSANGNGEVSALVESYRKKEQEHKDLLVTAKPTHPDVQRLTFELESLKKAIPPEYLSAHTPVPNPVYQNLTAQLVQLKSEIQGLEQEGKKINQAMSRYTQHVQNTSRAEQELSAAGRTNAEYMRQREDLQGKLKQATLAVSLADRQKGSQLVVVDPATRPLEPAGPATQWILFAGLAASLASGLLAAISVEAVQKRVWTKRDLERHSITPVLAEIPALVSRSDESGTRRNKLVLAVIVLAGIYMGGLYYLYRNPAPLQSVLTPIFDRIAEGPTGE